MIRLLFGNEALGTYHAGVRVATAYAGTPSTEILESIAGFDDVSQRYPGDEEATDVLRQRADRIYCVNGAKRATELKNIRRLNMFMLCISFAAYQCSYVEGVHVSLHTVKYPANKD